MSDISSSVSAEQLRLFIEKIENLEQEKSELQEQIKEVCTQAKNEGFDVGTIKQIVRMRKMKKEDLMEQQELLELYAQALGMPI
jgi:uncharacterized protein (UPF0335 family)